LQKMQRDMFLLATDINGNKRYEIAINF